MNPSPTISPDNEVAETILGAQGMLTTMGGGFLMLLGAAALIWAIASLARKLMRPEEYAYGSSWGSIVLMIIFGGGSVVAGQFLMGSVPADEEVTASPSPSPTPSPSAEEPKGEPISLPEVSNPGALWTWLAAAAVALLILVGIYLFIQKVRRDRVRKIELENSRREAEEKARKLAEEEARRQRETEEKRARIEARWATITDLHAELKRRIVDAETDWDTLFDLPALTDVSHRQTRALHRAMRDAENAVIPMPAGFTESTPMDKIPYVKKVHAFEDAWKVALTHAQKVGTTKLPDDEIRTIKRIRLFLTMAEGPGASEHERARAYEQIRKLIGELHVVQLPNRALAAVEARQRLAITAGSEPELATVATNVPRPMRAR